VAWDSPFGIPFPVSLIKHAQVVVPFAVLGATIGVDADTCCVAFIDVSNSGCGCYSCSFGINFLLDEVPYNYSNGRF